MANVSGFLENLTIYGTYLTLKPASEHNRNHTGKYLRPLNKYRQAKSIEDYWNQRVEQRNEILALRGKLPCTVVGPKYGVSFSNVAYLWRKYATE